MSTKVMAKTGSERDIPEQESLAKRRVEYFKKALGNPEESINNLAKYMTRQNMAKLIAYHEVFTATKDVGGSFVECGVYHGNGLMTWAKLMAAFEPYNYTSKVIGFDTFQGNTELSERDKSNAGGAHKAEGGYFADSYEDLQECISLYDGDRPIPHIEKIELVKGDLRETAPEYIKNNRHLLVRVLALTVNLYEPTKAALKAFVPRMGKGSAIMPFTINTDIYPGMTESILEELDIKDYTIKTFPYYPNISMIIL